MSAPLKVGLAGLGTVGVGTFRLLAEQVDLIARRCGRRVQVVAVCARDRKADRGIDLEGVRWHDDARALASDPEVEVVAELIGGADGAALELCRQAIANGKHVVTANKALLAHHGTRLAAAAEERGVSLAFEAAVAGGIPIIKALREGLAGNRVARAYGILNGTCNYILTAMRDGGREFEEALREAQRLGYAESDPTFDVDGIDTAHKLAILTAVAFGCPMNFDAVYIEGVRHVTAMDIAFARELGYHVKLLGIAGLTEDGIEQRVHPCMVSLDDPIAHVDGVFNAIVVEGASVDRAMFVGRGAGAGPTASAVVADLMDIARFRHLPAFNVPTAELKEIAPAPMERHWGACYVRLMVVDRPGVMADVTAALRDEEVSIEAMIQRGRDPGEVVPVVMTTHETEEAAMARAVANIARLRTVLEPPRMIRIEKL
ncbi:MAG: homoserine dehydrogenase [Alphaproteobacteria bacterium]